jgi:hypothetical protein
MAAGEKVKAKSRSTAVYLPAWWPVPGDRDPLRAGLRTIEAVRMQPLRPLWKLKIKMGEPEAYFTLGELTRQQRSTPFDAGDNSAFRPALRFFRDPPSGIVGGW